MPYTNAVISELLRWNSVAPSGKCLGCPFHITELHTDVNLLGVPHVAIEDGFVGGYFIPKDSMILANLW
jgi:cytochrome P450